MDVTIACAHKEHLPLLKRLMLEAYDSFHDEKIAAIQKDYIIAPYARALESGNLLIALKGHEAVGICHLNMQSDECHLSRIYVHPKYRHQGIASRMIEKAEKVAKENHYEAMTLQTIESLQNAVKLYEKLGFKKENITDGILNMRLAL